MMKRLASIQSNYIPWKGYFDTIAEVDEFVLLDEVQYTRRDWRNRNRIKTASGVKWLSIPVQAKGKFHQRIDETAISDPSWAEQHWRTIAQSYSKATHFDELQATVRGWFEAAGDLELLTDVNELMIRNICDLLGISTAITRSTDYATSGDKTDRLVSLCKSAGATTYLSGPAARAYLEHEPFSDQRIEVEYIDYGVYPEYAQLHEEFEHGVTILDLLFNVGANCAHEYMHHVPAPVARESGGIERG